MKTEIEPLKNTKYNICIGKSYHIIKRPDIYFYQIKCANCDNIINIKKGTWESALNEVEPRIFSCCKECAHSKKVFQMQLQKRKNKFGVENMFQREDIKEKIKETIKKKYGEDNISKTQYFKDKSKETWTKKYGVDHPLKDKDILEKVQTTRKEKYGDDLHGWAVKSKMFQTNMERYGNKWYFASDIGKQTLDNFIKLYGEIEGKEKWDKKIQACKQTLDNFILRHGVTEGNLRYEYWKSACVQTRENFIKRHGEIEGERLYIIYAKKRLKNLLSNGKYTKLNDRFEKILLDLVPATEIIREYLIPDNKKNYFYDFYFPNKNIIIEVNGDFWHCTPRKYSAEESVTFPGGTVKKVKDIWERDQKKNLIPQKENITVVVFWEYDIKKNIDNVINELNRILKNEENS